MDAMTIGLFAVSALFLFLYLRRRRARIQRETD